MSRLFVTGMPASGKSTFIGAITHLLTSGRSDAKLALVQLSDTEKYAASLEEGWLSCVIPGRTRDNSGGEAIFTVRDVETGVEAELILPDHPGETFRDLPAIGQCPTALFEALLAADGFLLFTSAGYGEDDRMIYDDVDLIEALDAGRGAKMDDPAVDALIATREASALGQNGEGTALNEHEILDVKANELEGDFQIKDEMAQTKSEDLTIPFSPEGMPEQVLVVELLQQLNRTPLKPRRRSLALVISAWDVVESHITPAKWLESKRPMLSQFLEHSSELWVVELFAVSALGGALPQDAERLLAERDPINRIKVIARGGTTTDLTTPIRWLMAGPSDA